MKKHFKIIWALSLVHYIKCLANAYNEENQDEKFGTLPHNPCLESSCAKIKIHFCLRVAKEVGFIFYILPSWRFYYDLEV